jgi:hypothetical protein
MKAMLAASQCPHCGHLFELRDGFGAMLPLAHCADCDSYYPARQGSCRWCGTAPEGFRLAPYALKGVGVLAFAGLVSAAWFANRGDDEAAPAELVSVPKETSTAVLTTRVDSGVDFQAPVLAGIEDTASDFTATPMPVSVETGSSSTDPAGMPFQGPGTDAVEPNLLGSSDIVAPRAPAPKKTAVRPARSARWIRATARRWVTVRASPTQKSRILASVGPDTRVQLGETRGDWRRIRMKGISGWVERAKF